MKKKCRGQSQKRYDFFLANLLIEIRDIDGSSDDIFSLSHACSSIHPPFPLTKALLLQQIKTIPFQETTKKKI